MRLTHIKLNSLANKMSSETVTFYRLCLMVQSKFKVPLNCIKCINIACNLMTLRNLK